jgi:pyruvate,orthophosphate dikinase
VSREDVLRALLIKGYASPEMMGSCLFSSTEQAASLLDQLTAGGLVETTSGSFRLTAGGKIAAGELVADDRQAWGVDQAATALDAFLSLDARVKQTVTDWQMREVDGSQQLNDHSDLAHDLAVLDRLSELHGDAVAWLRPLEARLARLGRYEARLERAARLALNGDPAYVASPRVDSYHSVWFELHEDLIHLAGRTRAEEAATGRA